MNGSEPAWATGLTPGGAATVPTGAVHYAENPSCGTIQILQVHSGLPPTYVSGFSDYKQSVKHLVHDHDVCIL